MPRPRFEPNPDESARLGDLRADAAAQIDELLAAGPELESDPLGALAWKAGMNSPQILPFDDELRELIEACRDARYQ